MRSLRIDRTTAAVARKGRGIGVWGVIGICALLWAKPVWADDPMTQARALIEAGQLDAAQGLLSAWQPAQSEARVQRLWALALLARQRGDLRAARAYLGELVALRPDVAPFRLELARVLDELGEGERAAHHAAMGGAPATAQAAFDAEPAFTRRLSLAVIPQSNPARRTDAEIIEVLGLPFVLAPGSRAQPATGLRATGQIGWSPRLAPSWRARLSASIAAEVYDRALASDTTITLGAGLSHVTAGGLRLDAGLSYSQRWIGGRDFSMGPGVNLGFSRRIGARGELSGGAAVQWVTHPGAAAADGPRIVGVLAYAHRLSPQTALRGSLRLERTEAGLPSLSLSAAELGVGVTHAFRGGLVLGVDLSQRQTRHDGGTMLFPQPRADDRTTLRLRLLHGQIEWQGFAPVLEVEATLQGSNVPVNAFTNIGLSLGLTRTF